VETIRELVQDRRRVAVWGATAVGLYVAWLLVDNLNAKGMPPGIIVLGVVTGSLYGLNALGIVLIYRANRVVNFAQAELGSVAAVTTIELVRVAHVPYFVACAAGIALALVMGSGISALVIRRFANAPRLIVAVATIGLAQILLGISILIPILAEKELSSGGFNFPWDARLTIFPVIFSGAHVMAMIVVPIVMVALAAFLRFTHYGNAIRAAADNGDRAALVGIPVPRLSTIVWALAGGLSALAVILRTQLVGFVSFSGVSGGGTALLMIVLAAAVLARMESMPRAVLGGVAIGVFQQGASWLWPRTTIVDAMMLVIILVGLLIQRDAFNRAAETGISTWKAMREVRPIPRELLRVREVVRARWTMRVVLAAILLTLPLWTSISQQESAALVAIYSIVALSLLMLTGWAGHISLGQFALVGFGGAATGKLYGSLGWDWTWAALGGVLCAALAALVIGLPALRIKGPFLAVTTLAFGVTASSFFLEERYVPWFVSEERVRRPILFGTIDLDKSWAMYFFALTVLAGAFVLVKHVRNARPGRALIAVRDNELAAESVSINAPRIKLLAFVLSGALAGLAGAVYLVSQQGVQPGAFTPDVSIRLFSMVVIGGLGSVPGAILGAVYVRGAEFFLPPEWELIASGIGILVLLLFAPEGLGGIVYGVRDRYLRWVARRNDLYVPSLLADVRLDEDGQRATRDTVTVDSLDLVALEEVAEAPRRRRERLVATGRSAS
jgi:branched-chain amino acid transport system permease protein